MLDFDNDPYTDYILEQVLKGKGGALPVVDHKNLFEPVHIKDSFGSCGQNFYRDYLRLLTEITALSLPPLAQQLQMYPSNSPLHGLPYPLLVEPLAEDWFTKIMAETFLEADKGVRTEAETLAKIDQALYIKRRQMKQDADDQLKNIYNPDSKGSPAVINSHEWMDTDELAAAMKKNKQALEDLVIECCNSNEKPTALDE